MFEGYRRELRDKHPKLKELKELLDRIDELIYGEQYDQLDTLFINLNLQQLTQIFEWAKIDSKLQIELWQLLPYEKRNNPENSKIFEGILDNKFGDYIKDVNKKELVKLLSSSKSERSNG